MPHGSDWQTLQTLIPVFFSYVLSFVYVGIYWNNHHHLLHAVKHVSASVLWANLHLLFWLSLLPFVTGWMGENHFASAPTALYGGVLLMAGLAYWILVHCIITTEGKDSLVAKAVGKDAKGLISVVIYAAAIPIAFFHVVPALLAYLIVTFIWLVPDRRIEKTLLENGHS